MESLETKTTENTAGRNSAREELRAEFAHANEYRDYTIYTRLMDAALEAKAQSIFPYFEVEEGDIIVDAGSGTGQLAELAAREFRGAHVFALDLSHELHERARESQALTKLIFGDVQEVNFPPNSVKVKYYSTSGHEIETFGGTGSMRRSVENTFQELVPGGMVIIRDFAKPARTEPVFMKIFSRAGLAGVSPGTPDDEIDYSMLSTGALLYRFQQEFHGGGAFQLERVIIGGAVYFRISPEWAHEFYLRKDYTANWRQEIKEKYTYWTMEKAEKILRDVGYVDIRVIPDPNDYVLKNRLQGKIELYEMKDGALSQVPFPATHMVVVGKKPQTGAARTAENLPEPVDYEKLLETIRVIPEEGVVKIGENVFHVADTTSLVGTKKNVYRLKSENPRMLKTVRSDGRNHHAVFKSMYQIVARRHILEEFGVPHCRIVEYDRDGPPYRYLVQEDLPEGSVSAADLIRQNALTETDVLQMAAIVNAFEKGKKWQLDTNPFNWFRVPQPDGTTRMTYVDGKVYKYDEEWAFPYVGLLQWIDPRYCGEAENFSAKIPTAKDVEAVRVRWREGGGPIDWWKKYLHSDLHLS